MLNDEVCLMILGKNSLLGILVPYSSVLESQISIINKHIQSHQCKSWWFFYKFHAKPQGAKLQSSSLHFLRHFAPWRENLY